MQVTDFMVIDRQSNRLDEYRHPSGVHACQGTVVWLLYKKPVTQYVSAQAHHSQLIPMLVLSVVCGVYDSGSL